MHRSSFRLSSIALITLIVATNLASTRSAVPYKIAPLKNVHETMTLMASDCLQKVPFGTRPSVCLQSTATVMENKVLKKADLDLRARGLGVVYAEELSEAVKWPDDPTREIGGGTIAKLGLKLLRQCEKYYSSGVNHGLLCSSHNGTLQFWHSMASSPNEPTKETHRKMLAWAEFVYEVAVGDMDLKLNYCDYWKAQREVEGKGELARALVPDNYFVCTKDGNPWTISTLFSLSCKNPFTSTKCNETRDPRVARINAIGALLHMVQDSFAQGHAGRGSCRTNPETWRITSKVECLPISQFYAYSSQDINKHGEADAPPEMGSSCLTTSTVVDEPILASANVLWLIQQKKGKEAFTKYLRDRVFPLADHHQPGAGPGDCFAKVH